MGTLSDIVTKIRLRIKEDKVQYFSNSDLVELINDQIFYAYSSMKNIECKAIINETEITLVDGTSEYAISDFGGIVNDQVFDSNRDSVPLYSEFEPDTFSYDPTATGIKFYNFTDGDEIVVFSWATNTVLSNDDFTIADIPFDGYWDDAIMRAVVVECQEIREHDNSRTSVFAHEAFNNALYACSERYGLIARRMQGTLNV